MKTVNHIAVMDEVKRYMDRVSRVKVDKNFPDHLESGRQTADLRRASLDLSRALTKLRRDL